MFRALSKSLRFSPAHYAAKLGFSSIREDRGPFATQDQPMPPAAPGDDDDVPISQEEAWARELRLRREKLQSSYDNSTEKLVKMAWNLAETDCALQENRRILMAEIRKSVIYERIGEILRKQKEMKCDMEYVDNEILWMMSEDGSGGSGDDAGDGTGGDGSGGSDGSDGNRGGDGTV
ncbi:unnamed protein product [Brassica oleracea]|uniref:Uncharacterized protein n=1 Tax=Brassica oleracea TaxID=3712 RepID=A0A3P6D1I6_BRAOL|nr:unnamed protein product [Brassica oleracea]